MNKESYSYYKNAYRANKRYKVKIGSDDYGPMLSKKEYEEYRAIGLDTKDIVYNQFHFYTRKAAKAIQESIFKEGYKVSLKDIQNRQFSQEVYDAISRTYKELRKTLGATEAATLISYTFYGS